MKISDFIKKTYITLTGYSYTNLGRLFLRLFVGIMLIQFAINQIHNFDIIASEAQLSFSSSAPAILTIAISVEIVCSLFVMAGFLTRLMTLPLFLLMIIVESALYRYSDDAQFFFDVWQQQILVPVMFLGFYFFILLVGPGKISVDYFLSLHLIHSDNKSETELEEV